MNQAFFNILEKMIFEQKIICKDTWLYPVKFKIFNHAERVVFHVEKTHE